MEKLKNSESPYLEKELSELLKDLEKYDKQHNQDTWMGKGLSAIFMNEIGSEEGLQDLQKEIKQNLTLENLEARHGRTLKSIGLELESPNKKGDIDENETYASGSIKINLKDKQKYLTFLKILDKENLTETQKKILEIIIEKLIYQVQNEYELEKPDDRFLELFLGMREIISEYEKLGMGEKVTTFKDYLEHANSGYLKEYIYAKNKGMFKPIGEGFSFSTFQNDATYDYYLEYWNVFFETLEFIKKNPQANELYNKVIQYGIDCVNYADTDPGFKKRLEENPNEHNIGLKQAIDEIKEKVFKIPKL